MKRSHISTQSLVLLFQKIIEVSIIISFCNTKALSTYSSPLDLLLNLATLISYNLVIVFSIQEKTMTLPPLLSLFFGLYSLSLVVRLFEKSSSLSYPESWSDTASIRSTMVILTATHRHIVETTTIVRNGRARPPLIN